MAYHETYWVVVGTAAPVIALAQIVALPDVMSTLIESASAKAPRGWRAGLLWFLDIFLPVPVVMLAIANLVNQGTILWLALQSLNQRADYVWPSRVAVFSVGGLFLLALEVAVVALLRTRKGRAKESRSRSTSGREEGEKHEPGDTPADSENRAPMSASSAGSADVISGGS